MVGITFWLPIVAKAQTAPAVWTSAELLFDATSGWGEHHALAADPFGFVHLVWEHNASATSSSSRDFRLGETMFNYSRWDGDEWSAPVDILFGDISTPRIAADGSGRLHAIFANGQCTSHSWAWIQDANTARGWSAPQCIGPRGLNLPFTIDAAGVLHVLVAQPEQLLYLQSKDGGSTWRDPIKVTENPQNATDTPGIAVGAQGVIHAVWSQAQLPEGVPYLGIYYSHSFDEGATWAPARTLIEGNYRDPAIATSGQQVYVVWNSGVTEGRRFLARSTDEGRQWAPPVVIVEAMGGWLWHPGIAVDSAGSVHIVTAQGAGALYTVAAPEGNTSLPVQLFDPNQQTAAPYVAASHGNRLLTVFRGPNASLYYALGKASAPEVPPNPLPDLEVTVAAETQAAPSIAQPTPTSVTRATLPAISVGTPQQSFQTTPLIFGMLPVIILVVGVVLFNLRRHR